MIDVNDLHPENAYCPIDVTDDGMVIDARFLQSQKTLFPIDVIFDVKFTFSKLVHPLNVSSLILVTPDGIMMDVNDSHPSNALIPIDVTEDGMIIDVRFLQL